MRHFFRDRLVFSLPNPVSPLPLGVLHPPAKAALVSLPCCLLTLAPRPIRTMIAAVLLSAIAE